MERGISGKWRILAATVFSVVLIGGAYVLAQGFESPQSAQASAETALLKAIAVKDSDGDGLPDWEEALYGTDPHIVDTFHLGMTDGEAVSRGLIVPKALTNSLSTATSSASVQGSLTDTFAKSFFSLYLVAKNANGGADLTDAQTSTLASQALSQIPQSIAQPAGTKTMADIKVSGTGPDALRTFAVAAEAVFEKNMGSATTSEIQSLENAVQNNDTEAFSQLIAASQIYRNYAAGLAATPVPQELAADNLALINAMLLRSKVDHDFTQVNTDPLAAMLALQQFAQTESAFWNVFTDIGSIYTAAGVVLPAGTPGALFVNVVAQPQSTTP